MKINVFTIFFVFYNFKLLSYYPCNPLRFIYIHTHFNNIDPDLERFKKTMENVLCNRKSIKDY